MKVVLTGANGGVGRIVQQLAPGQSRMDLAAYSRQELDILDKQALVDCLLFHRPDYLINAAAFTHVDQAEKTPDAAFLLNAGCLEGMTEACRKAGTTLIHLSTDYVFVYGLARREGCAFVSHRSLAHSSSPPFIWDSYTSL